VEHDRFGTIRQQIWTLLHYPLHLAIVLTVEGSTQFITWWIAVENLKTLENNLALDLTYNRDNTTNFVNGLKATLIYFDARFKKEYIPDFSYNLTQIESLDITKPDEQAEIYTIVGDIASSLITWIFKIFGFKVSEELTKDAKDNFAKAEAVYVAYSTVFVFFLIAAGCVLILLGIMYWFGKNHKSRGEMVSVVVRIVAGAALALVSTSIYTNASGALSSSPMMIPLVVIVYLFG
jgi:hypothetical protein